MINLIRNLTNGCHGQDLSRLNVNTPFVSCSQVDSGHLIFFFSFLTFFLVPFTIFFYPKTGVEKKW